MSNDFFAAIIREKARAIRVRTLQMIHAGPEGHPGHLGGSLSSADLVAALYFAVMRLDPRRPDWHGRDRFVLSKGHAAPAVYAALAERGFFPLVTLTTLRRVGSSLQGHPDMRKTPGIDMSSGSLGQGLSTAVGMALGGKMDRERYHVFVLLSDGEMNEGQCWEAAMTAAKYKLGNLTAIVDCNGIQNDGYVEEVMSLGNLMAKWEAFGWEATEIDGHDPLEIYRTLSQSGIPSSRPKVILASTIKGKGISFMENRPEWHARALSDDELAKALAELEWTGGGLI